MFSRLKLLALTVLAADLVLLGVMVYYISWLFTLAFVFVSCLLGGWVLNDGLRSYMLKSGQYMNADKMSAENFMLGAAARLAAGVLLMTPGVLTDIMALLLLSPAGKWLARFFIASVMAKMFPQFSHQKFDFPTSAQPPAKDQIIDVQVKDDDEHASANGR